MKNRIIGYDFARALAIFGMVIVNFKVVMGAGESGPDRLVWLVGLLEGRAAATFVILAGVGLSLLSRRSRLANDKAALRQNRIALLKRALFLFVIGLLYTPLWPADILHFYGIYIAIGAFLLSVRDWQLWMVSIGFMLGFVILLLLFDYEQGWNWNTLAYTDFWTPQGMIRHLFFNGFHPVFPWTGFLIVGMWLGRQDMSKIVQQRRILLIGLGAVFLAEIYSWLLILTIISNRFIIDSDSIVVLLRTAPLPPMPLYMLSAGGTALVVITLSIMITERFSSAGWIVSFVHTGQLALTHYVGHVIVGMGVLESLGLLEDQTLIFAVGSASIFCVGAVLFSVLWRRSFNRGPLEWMMRRVTG